MRRSSHFSFADFFLCQAQTPQACVKDQIPVLMELKWDKGIPVYIQDSPIPFLLIPYQRQLRLDHLQITDHPEPLQKPPLCTHTLSSGHPHTSWHHNSHDQGNLGLPLLRGTGWSNRAWEHEQEPYNPGRSELNWVDIHVGRSVGSCMARTITRLH